MLIYLPDNGFVGADDMTFIATDNRATGSASTIGRVEVVVESNDQPPLADSRTVLLTDLRPRSVDLASLVRDPDGGPVSSYRIGNPPDHGAVAIAGSTLTYTPTATLTDTDRISYVVMQERRQVAEGLIIFARTDPGDGPTFPPLADERTVTMYVSQTFDLDLLTLVNDPDGRKQRCNLC
ncbi:MAG: hypothetical protein HC884_13755 [Chloroflexaceae bacterium]|nr:hypothetical protein [Chloroflexaceae bacterium]